MEINYIIGDVTQPVETGLKYLLQVCNDVGAYGAGVSGAISKRWPIVETAYRNWHKNGVSFTLGQVQFIRVQSDIIVVNMIAQHLIGTDENGGPCIRYEAVKDCLKRVAKEIERNGGKVIAPRFGAGLSGGKWEEIEKIIIDKLINKNIPVTIYDFQ